MSSQNFLYILFLVVLEGKRPVILILDPNIIKSILVGNFDHFIDRPGFIFREKSYVKRMLISLRVSKSTFLKYKYLTILRNK